MRTGAVEIVGITPENVAPNYIPRCFTQMCETDKLTIACNDPDIGEIIRVCLNVKVRRFRVICTTVGKKLVVYANKEIELVVNNAGVHFHSCFVVPFCGFVLLDNDKEAVIESRIIIEDIDVAQISSRCVAVSSLLLVFPVFQIKPSCRIHDPNEICCDIDIRPCSGATDKQRAGRAPFLLGPKSDWILNK